MKKIFGLLLLCSILIPSPSFGVEVDWTHLDRTSYPWDSEGAWDLIEFNGHFYVAGEGNQDVGPQRIWRTQDFHNWENIVISHNIFVQRVERLLVHKNQIYAFAVVPDPHLPGWVLNVFRSNDGTSWEHLTTPFDNVKNLWDDVVSYGDYIFAHALFETTTYRFSGEIGANWEPLNPGEIRSKDIAFHVFGDTLYMAQGDIEESQFVEIWKTSNADFWEKDFDRVITKRDHIDKFNFTEYNGDLFFAYENLYVKTINRWRDAGVMHFSGNYLIYTTNGDIYTKLGPNSQTFQGATFRWDPDGFRWAESIGAQFQCFGLNHVPSVNLSDREYTLLCDLWSSKVGAYQLEDININRTSLSANETDVELLRWNIDFYLREQINQLRVVNLGTAEAGHEISDLKLYRSNESDNINDPPEFLGSFSYDSSVDPKAWTYTPNGSLALEEGDIFAVRADMGAENVRFGKTVFLALPVDGITWENNQTYQMTGPLTSTTELPITIFGVQGINLTGYNANPLAPGQRDRTVLAWVIEFLANEAITKIKVKNFGTAEAGVDLARLTLVRSDDRLVGIEAQEVVTDLIPDQNDPMMWTTPEPFNMALNEFHRYLLTVDVSESARARTIQLGIPSGGIEWATNEGFELTTDLVTNTVQQIIIPPPAPPIPIAEVIPFPNPARDEVKFTFDLDSQSEVIINIFNTSGQLVSEIKENKAQEFGAVVTWDARSLAPGMYLAVVKITSASGSNRLFKRKVFIKR